MDGEKGAQKERSFEIGEDEFWKAMMAELANNMKRAFDEYMGASLESIRQNQSYVQKILSDAQVHFNNQQNIATQALQNAVETANMVSKQAVRHADIAIDRQWNVNETDALATVLAGKIASELNKTKTS